MDIIEVTINGAIHVCKSDGEALALCKKVHKAYINTFLIP